MYFLFASQALGFLPLNLGAILQPSLTGHLPFLLYVLTILQAAILPVAVVIDHSCALIFLLPSPTIATVIALLQVSPFKHFPQMWTDSHESIYRVGSFGAPLTFEMKATHQDLG